MDVYDVVLFVCIFERFYLKKQNTLTCILHFIHFQGILPTEMMLWLRILVSLKDALAQGGEGIFWFSASLQRVTYPGYWMMMKVGQPKTGISEAQSGSVGSRRKQGPWRNDRWCLTPGLVSPDLPFWAIILICLAGLLVLIMGLISFFLVSKEVLFSYYQVVRAFYIL